MIFRTVSILAFLSLLLRLGSFSPHARELLMAFSLSFIIRLFDRSRHGGSS